MSSLVAIVGATGKQGGAVARSLLLNPSFKVRAITRDASSQASQSLAPQGVEIVQADGFDAVQILAAFHNAWGAFINLSSDDEMWRDPDGPTEFDLGKSIVDAAAEAGVRHLVYSSGPPCSAMTGGKVAMKAMDSMPWTPSPSVEGPMEANDTAVKYKIEQHARRLGTFQTVTAVNAAWYLENFLTKEVAPAFGGFPHFPDDEGYLTFRVPNWGGDNKVPFLSVRDDFGDIVHGIFLDPARWDGHVVHGVSDIRSFDHLVDDFQQGMCAKASERERGVLKIQLVSNRQEIEIPASPTFLGGIRDSGNLRTRGREADVRFYSNYGRPLFWPGAKREPHCQRAETCRVCRAWSSRRSAPALGDSKGVVSLPL